MTGPTPPDAVALALARMEIKLNQIIERGGDHEARLRALESGRWPLPTVTVLLSTGATVTAVLALIR